MSHMHMNRDGGGRFFFMIQYAPRDSEGQEVKDIRTDPDLIEALRRSAGQEMTEEEIRQQKISFIMGTSSFDSKITREEVAACLDRMAGRRPGK